MHIEIKIAIINMFKKKRVKDYDFYQRTGIYFWNQLESQKLKTND